MRLVRDACVYRTTVAAIELSILDFPFGQHTRMDAFVQRFTIKSTKYLAPWYGTVREVFFSMQQRTVAGVERARSFQC